VAHLHEELSSSTERLQAELAEWQGRCEDLEGQLQAHQAHSSQLEQDLKTRPTPQQVTTALYSAAIWPVGLYKAGEYGKVQHNKGVQARLGGFATAGMCLSFRKTGSQPTKAIE
jgi:hypothetical protein